MVICLERDADLHTAQLMLHCHSLSLASVKSRLVLPFWYRLTRVVPDKGPLNGCVRVCVYTKLVQKTYIQYELTTEKLKTEKNCQYLFPTNGSTEQHK